MMGDIYLSPLFLFVKSMKSDIERYITVSAKIDTSDIDWNQARDAGLNDDEKFVLTYFSDVESQTIRYLKTLLQMKIAFTPSVSAFLTTWSYEEFFHGYELARLLAVCDKIGRAHV